MAPKRHAASTTPSSPQPSTTTTTTSTTSTPATKLSSGPHTLKSSSSIQEIAQHVWHQYLATTPQRTLLLDAFMAFLVLVGGIQFVYCLLAGNYPFNAFLSGFCAAVGQFVLTASLRMQTSGSGSMDNNVVVEKGGSKGKGSSSSSTVKGDVSGSGSGISHERAFADYIFGSLILHFFCINFIN